MKRRRRRLHRDIIEEYEADPALLNEEGLPGSAPPQCHNQHRAAAAAASRLVVDGGEPELFIDTSALISFM